MATERAGIAPPGTRLAWKYRDGRMEACVAWRSAWRHGT
ncbi:hypothetical protein ES319_D01G212100v1 [Gossypium barbadense]|uniref:Uncharacterized protein n=2 Tax=Gossypium TaxID=3633 RepID=A0A5J5SRE0_GOSBA|nr:hypothetical protein ES319_D01G212100v1 [Gossypium barbadense]TYG84160.1 hypothetical protein ES288_D01G227200v1 [Gossypium darwinii]